MRGLPPLPQENLSGECDPSPVGDREREVTGTTCPLRHSPTPRIQASNQYNSQSAQDIQGQGPREDHPREILFSQH